MFAQARFSYIHIALFGIFLTILFFASTALVRAADVSVKVDENDISLKSGSYKQGTLSVTNDDSKKIEGTLSLSNDDDVVSRDISGVFENFRFYGEIPEDYAEDFDEKKDIEKICEDRDESEELDVWCDGVTSYTLEIAAGETADVYYSLRVLSDQEMDEEEVKAYVVFGEVVAENEDDTKDEDEKDEGDEEEDEDEKDEGDEEEDATEVYASAGIAFTPLVDKIAKARITELKLTRTLGTFDFFGWIRTNFSETYDSVVVIENTGNKEVEYVVSLSVDRENKPEEILSTKGVSQPSDEEEIRFEAIAMPRVGNVNVKAMLSYENKGEKIVSETDVARISMTPFKEIVAAGFALLFTLFVLLVIFRMRKKRLQNAALAQPQLSGVSEDMSISDEYEALMGEEMPDGDVEKIPVQHSDQGVEENPMIQDAGTIPASVSGIKSLHSSPNKASLSDQSEIPQAGSLTGVPSEPPVGPSGDRRHEIDLEWMREDEEIFRDAMRAQERRTNMKIGAFAIILLGIASVAAFFVVSKEIIFKPQKTTVSIVDLNEDAANEDVDVDNPDGDSDTSDDADGDNEKDETKDVDEDAEDTDLKDRSEFTVQVLNAGGKNGAAGALTSAFDKLEYKTLAASNAKNAYTGSIVYHGKDAEDAAKRLLKDTEEDYPDMEVEESQSVLDTYDADFVVVLGEGS